MATSEPREINVPENETVPLCTVTTSKRSSGDTDSQWGCKYSYRGEDDLHLHSNKCRKNPGHKNFIPVDNLNIDDLPENYRDKDVIVLIQTVSDLTCRVTVKYVSDRRPANVPGSLISYPGYKFRGQRRTTFGTSRVTHVDMYSDCVAGLCKCKECRNSSKPENNFAIIHLITAAHVVFDDLEGEHTTCHLFFDRGGTLETCSGVVTLTGMSRVDSNVLIDKCFMAHYTHDLDLARRLDQRVKRLTEQCWKVRIKLREFCTFKKRRAAQDRQPLVFIVSHPHGCSKQVSIGHVTRFHVFISSIVSFNYSTATCPGSSGAPVVLVPASAAKFFNEHLLRINGIHIGVSAYDDDNCCVIVKGKVMDAEDLAREDRECQGKVMDAEDLAREDRESQGKVMDAEDLSREDRECQGPWEAEYSYLEGADTNHLYDECTKNPDHKNFIPAYEFGKEHLPEEYRDDDIVEYIRAVADLTVCVSMTYVSDKRPDRFPGTRKHYPHYKIRGKRRMTFGTGWIEKVDMPLGRNRESCLCQECLKSDFCQTHQARIFIQTASHVVYDSAEGEHTTCHLYFDKGPRPQKCPGVVSLTGVTLRSKQINRDMCEMIYYTHDLTLVDKLKQQLEHKKILSDKISSKLPQFCQIKRRLDDKDKQPLVFIVSHPHGCSKRISFGRCTNINMCSNDNFQFLYDTATCPGSSGGPVCMVQKHNLQFMYGRKDCTYLMEIHCGNFDVDKTLNYCSVITGYPSLQMVTMDTLLLDDGTWEDNFPCVAEDVLHDHFRTCQKNSGHPNFFPVEGFSSSCLPPLYRAEEVMKFIKIVSDLTVRVTVKYVSEERPDTVPGTRISYPWSRNKGSNLMRVGSGEISEVKIFKNDYLTCDCKECKGSPNPRREFAHICIDTAAHLVYDVQEAEHTTCHMFFDSGETPAFCRGAVTLAGTMEGSRNTSRDWCRLIHVTHDLELADKIDEMMKVYDKCLQAMEEYDYFNPMESGKQNGRKYARGEIPLNLVISHPHGASKQISIGYRGNAGTGLGQLYYTSTTCPGSSGAPSIQLGWETFFPYVE